MNGVIESKLATIATICRRFSVQRLWVFGSATTGRFDPDRSDVDFMVEFGSEAPRDYIHHFFPLEEALARAVGRPVDVVEPQAIRNPYFRASALAGRILIYEAA